MNSSSSERDPVERLADEFLERYRRGERPALTEYTDKYPHWAERIRKVFPALVLMEGIRPATGETTGADGGVPVLEEQHLEMLGDYRILREVGRGGMGIVYEAEQESLGRHVALKVLPSQALLDSRHVQRFQREAKAAARLHHTNIVPVYGVGEEAGLHYYVMQFIQGLGLDEVLAEVRRVRQAKQGSGETASSARPSSRRKEVSVAVVAHGLLTGHFEAGLSEPAELVPSAPTPLPSAEGEPAVLPAPLSGAGSGVQHDSAVHLPGQTKGSSLSESGRHYWQSVARVGIQVAEALAYAHSQGVLHRDIKPSNLLLDTHGNVWVTDFGLAKVAGSEDLTHSGDIVGTVRYLAPERFEGKADARSDLYALGLTLYELLTLRSAFDETDRNKLIAQVMHAEPARPRQIEPEVPRDLETIVLKALERDPERRYQTADELADELKRFVAGEPIRARRVSAWQRLVLWARRRPAVAALVAVSGVAALAVVGVAVALVYSSRLEDANSRLGESNGRLQEALEDAHQARNTAEEQRQQANWFRYVHAISLAHAEWRDGNVTRVQQLLQECRTTPSRWEWNYLQRLCHGDLFTLQDEDVRPDLVVFSPDGAQLASASEERATAKVWEVATGRERHTFKVPGRGILCLAFSPEGKRLAVSFFVQPNVPGVVKIWDLQTGREVLTLTGHKTEVSGLAFSPDGTRLATAGHDRTVKVWAAATGQELRQLQGHAGLVRAVAFSPDGSRLASASHDWTVKVWDVGTGQDLLTLRGHRHPVAGVAFSPDGSRLASASYDRTVKLWDARTGGEIFTLKGHSGWIQGLAFSPDGAWLATSSFVEEAVHIWEVTTGRKLFTCKGPTKGVWSVAFAPDGTKLVAGGQDGILKVWGMTAGDEPLTLQGHTAISHVTFSPDGTRLATAGFGDRSVKIWDALTGQEIRTLRGLFADVMDVAFSPDGRRLTAAGRRDLRLGQRGAVTVWDAANGKELLSLDGQRCVAFSPDGARLASTNEANSVKVWDAATGKDLLTLDGHQATVMSVAFSPDQTRLASGDSGQTVKVWDAVTGRELLTLKHPPRMTVNRGPILGVKFSPDGTRLASASSQDTVKIWDVATGRELLTLKGHDNGSNRMAFSPDGTRLATAGYDQLVKVWDVATGQELLTLRGHTGTVGDVAFSPDGWRLASASWDQTVKIWDARPVTAETPVEREALELLDFLFAKPLCRADVKEYLENSPTISLAARQLAREFVDRYREEQDPERYRQAAWTLVRQPYLNTFQYRFALHQAETACRLAPREGKYRLILGVSQYRTAQYPQALETLGEADRLHEGIPANLAFLAMTQWQLGQQEQAQATLTRLRETTHKPEWAKTAEAQAFLHEAEALLQEPRKPAGR
jgi:WD40 repeat protein/serine/threonine protein kinase